MTKRRKPSMPPLMMRLWVGTLSLITLVLIVTAEPGAVQYWVRVGTVALLWGILVAIHLGMADKVVVSSKPELVVIGMILLLFLTLTMAAFLNALARGKPGMTLLFGLAGWGIFNVTRELATELTRRRNGRSNRSKSIEPP